MHFRFSQTQPSQTSRAIELALIFGFIPLFIAFIPPVLAVVTVFAAIVYCSVLVKKQYWQALSSQWHFPAFNKWKWVAIRFAGFVVLSTAYMYVSNPNDLFRVVIDAPGMWVTFCLVYIFVSVIPQEVLYRFFFFARYETLLNIKWVFVLVNASLFCIAHTLFHSNLVFLLTFIGGLMFANTYYESRSLLLVCVEHMLYGLWLYTVGMGAMLAFPMPQ